MNHYPAVSEHQKNTLRLKFHYLLTLCHDQRVHDGIRHGIMKLTWFVIVPVLLLSGILASIFTFAPRHEPIPLAAILFQMATTVIVLQFVRLTLCNLRPFSPGLFIKAYLLLTVILTGLALMLPLPRDTFISVLGTQAVLANVLLLYGGLMASFLQGLARWLRRFQ